MASAPRASIAARTRREVIRRIVTKGRVRENLQNQGPVGQLVVLREPQVRIELTTARLRIGCSTPELLWPRYALERTRTAMPYGTTPSRWRVYQFHHQGIPCSHLATFPPARNALGCTPLAASCFFTGPTG